VAGSSVSFVALDRVSGKPSLPGTPTRLPSRSYVHEWYGHASRRALPQPSAMRDWRCRQTLSNARTVPSETLVIRMERPITVLVQYVPGLGSSDA
jgi:hypothetical protein